MRAGAGDHCRREDGVVYDRHLRRIDVRPAGCAARRSSRHLIICDLAPRIVCLPEPALSVR
jgi:hypothetical protein